MQQRRYSSFTRYVGQLHCLADGSLVFEVFQIEPAGTSPLKAIGKPPYSYRFDSCVVLDDNILSRLDMQIDWSNVNNETYTRGYINE